MSFNKKRDESVKKILKAAMEVFSESGYSGARVDEIARRAGVNKAMIYYRIGDKKTLYTLVIRSLFGDIASAIQENISENADSEEKLKLYIRGLARTIVEQPYLPGIMMRELASGGSNINEVVAKDFASILAIPGGILSDGIKKGIFIKTDPLIIHMMVVGFMMFFRSTHPLREKLFSAKPDIVGGHKNKTIGEGMREIEKLILKALKK